MNINEEIEKIARKENLSVQQVTDAMQESIAEAYLSGNPEMLSIAKGNMPTVEEYLNYMYAKIKVFL